MEKVIITVDLGHFRAYKFSKEPLAQSPRIHLIESYDSLDAHGRMSEKVTDTAGRFGTGGGKNGSAKGYGEPHNLTSEIEKKAIKLIARDIGSIIEKHGGPKWYLAAEKKINKQILDSLDPQVRAKLEKNLAVNLTKTAKSELLTHFKS